MPAPSHSSGTTMPKAPSAASSLSASRGKVWLRSHSAAKGARRSCAKARIESRMSSCSSVRIMCLPLAKRLAPLQYSSIGNTTRLAASGSMAPDSAARVPWTRCSVIRLRTISRRSPPRLRPRSPLRLPRHHRCTGWPHHASDHACAARRSASPGCARPKRRSDGPARRRHH